MALNPDGSFYTDFGNHGVAPVGGIPVLDAGGRVVLTQGLSSPVGTLQFARLTRGDAIFANGFEP